MRKEEILEMSRKENKNSDLVEQEVYKKASLIGEGVGFLAIGFVMMITGFIEYKTNYGAFFIFFAIESGIFITKYVKLKKKHELIVSMIYTILAITMGVLFVLSTVGAL